MGPTHRTPTERVRFGFGENWARFAQHLPPTRIEAAEASLRQMLERRDLTGMTFLDIGSGSGLFSLSAARMGAEWIHSLDYDPESVATTAGLRERFAPDANWTIEQASVLDARHMESLGRWDIVYSWGVLHHTGDMWRALEHTCSRVSAGGRLFVSIYNDQGWASRAWARIKRIYNLLPVPLRVPYSAVVVAPMELKSVLRQTLKGQPGGYFREWRSDGDYGRGMSRWHDLVDWVGGYPFEVATPDQVFQFCAERGFALHKLRTVGGGRACNEFVFELPAREPQS